MHTNNKICEHLNPIGRKSLKRIMTDKIPLMHNAALQMPIIWKASSLSPTFTSENYVALLFCTAFYAIINSSSSLITK